MKENTKEDAERLDKILEDTKDEESQVKIGQAGNVLSHAQVQELKIQSEQLNNIAVILSSQAVLEQEDRERRESEVGINEVRSYSQGFTDMMGDDRKKDEFRGGAKSGR